MQKLEEGEQLIIAFEEIKKEREERIEKQKIELDDKRYKLHALDVKASNLELEKADLIKEVDNLNLQYHDTVEKL